MQIYVTFVYFYGKNRLTKFLYNIIMNLQQFRELYTYNTDKDVLGIGGFSKVYKAFDVRGNRYVALKFYQGSLGEKYDVKGEVKKVISLSHINLIKYYDIVSLEAPNIHDSFAKVQVGIMEYANAGDFNDFLKTFPSIEQISEVLRGVLQGLAYLHQNGIVHRDIKPQNILIDKQGNRTITKIADFGLAKRLTANQSASVHLMGTMEYMAPEQFNPTRYGINQQLDTNIDLWALGVILYEAFTGDLPFGNRNEGFTHEQVMYNIMQKTIETNVDDIPSPFNLIITRCLIKKAGDRAQSATELLDILDGKTTASKVYQKVNSINEQQAINEQLSSDEKTQLWVACILFTPLTGLFWYFSLKKQEPQKAATVKELLPKTLIAWLIFWICIVILLLVIDK